MDNSLISFENAMDDGIFYSGFTSQLCFDWVYIKVTENSLSREDRVQTLTATMRDAPGLVGLGLYLNLAPQVSNALC